MDRDGYLNLSSTFVFFLLFFFFLCSTINYFLLINMYFHYEHILRNSTDKRNRLLCHFHRYIDLSYGTKNIRQASRIRERERIVYNDLYVVLFFPPFLKIHVRCAFTVCVRLLVTLLLSLVPTTFES